jgi:serine/threonine protein phosphatase PrpC
VATEKLIQLANDRGGEDNISVAILRFEEQAAQVDVIRDPGPMLSFDKQTVLEGERDRRALLLYTTILCFVQVLLIFLIWLSVQG